MKKITKKILTLSAVAALGACSAFSFASCGNAKEINVTGSTSVSPLMQKLAAEYEKSHDVTIIVTTSDSSTGIAEAKEGKNDLGMASKAVNESDLTTVQIATDGVALIVNKNSVVEDVTPFEVYELYAKGTPIQTDIVAAISREEGSGTRDAFGELIKNEAGDKLSAVAQFASCVSVQNATGTVKSVIAANNVANTIGYISMGSLDNTVKALKVNGAEATVDNIKSGVYSLSRPFNVVYNTTNGLSEEAKDFLDFILSEEGQGIVDSEGYVTVL